MIKEIDRQVDTFIKLGFHQALKQTEEDYRQAFKSSAKDQPEIYRGKFDRLVVFDPRVQLGWLNKAAGIYEWFPVEDFKDPGVNPKTPYAFWTNGLSKYLDYTAEDGVANFSDFEAGATLGEVVFMYLANRNFIFEYGAIAPESHFGQFHAAFSPFGTKKLELFPLRPEYRHPRFGVISRGREVILLG